MKKYAVQIIAESPTLYRDEDKAREVADRLVAEIAQLHPKLTLEIHIWELTD